MIISHKDKFAFFRVPKTGSSTAAVCLRMCGVFDDTLIASGTHITELPPLNMPEFVYEKIAEAQRGGIKLKHQAWITGQHWTPMQAINMGFMTMEQMREYNVYAFLREPKNRAISSFNFHNGQGGDPAYMRVNVKAHQFWGIAGVSQCNYFKVDGEQVVEPLDFGDYDNELRRVIDSMGGHSFTEIPKVNRTMKAGLPPKQADYMDSHTHKVLEQRYAEDYELYNSMMEKKHATND